MKKIKELEKELETVQNKKIKEFNDFLKSINKENYGQILFKEEPMIIWNFKFISLETLNKINDEFAKIKRITTDSNDLYQRILIEIE